MIDQLCWTLDFGFDECGAAQFNVTSDGDYEYTVCPLTFSKHLNLWVTSDSQKDEESELVNERDVNYFRRVYKFQQSFRFTSQKSPPTPRRMDFPTFSLAKRKSPALCRNCCRLVDLFKLLPFQICLPPNRILVRARMISYVHTDKS